MQEQNIEQFNSYPSYSCFISIEKIGDEKLLKIDFAIDYHDISNVIQNSNSNMVIHDKIYLNKQLKDELINELDIFVRTEYLSKNSKTNDLGFPYKEWNDAIGNAFVLEDTGMMNAACISLGCKTEDVFIKTDNGREKVFFKNKIRLSVDEAQRLKEVIKRQWILNDVKELEEALPINNQVRSKLKI